MFYLFLSISPNPAKIPVVDTLFSTTKEVRAWISLCIIAGEIDNGLPFPVMVVNDAKAMMAGVAALQESDRFPGPASVYR